MRSIGGYFGLELRIGKEFHPHAIKLNTGRNAFEYLLKVNQYSKVYLPYYICDVLLEPIKKLELDYEFYHINKDFLPLFDAKNIGDREAFLFVNYFGISDRRVEEVATKYINVIIDNSQAFFSKPLSGIDSFYSPRKFFGLPDGAYLYSNNNLQAYFEQDVSIQRFEHLLGRIDLGAEGFYQSFQNNDVSLSGQSIKSMSSITKRILSSIDYTRVLIKRQINYNFLLSELQNINELRLNTADTFSPMVYPLLCENGAELKRWLIANKVFVATYWPNVANWVNEDTVEYYFMTNMVFLPIDQRYNISDMKVIMRLIHEFEHP